MNNLIGTLINESYDTTTRLIMDRWRRKNVTQPASGFVGPGALQSSTSDPRFLQSTAARAFQKSTPLNPKPDPYPWPKFDAKGLAALNSVSTDAGKAAVDETAEVASGLTKGLSKIGGSAIGGAVGSLLLGVPQAISSGISEARNLSFQKEKWDTLQQQSKSMGFVSPAQMFNSPSFGKQTTNRPVYASAVGVMDNNTLGAGAL